MFCFFINVKTIYCYPNNWAKTASIFETAIGFIKFYFIPKKLKDLPRKNSQIVK
jgi:hypothetical protein